jgi:hypothetical protein
VLRQSSLSLRATSITPARRSGHRRVRLLSAAAFPDSGTGRLSRYAFRGLRRVRYTLQPAGLPSLTNSDSFPEGFMLTRCQVTVPP